jgi:uncharacterized protein YndB with AHSA1/START domain
MTEPQLTLVRDIPAAPRAVFEAFLDTDALARIMCPAAGMIVRRVEVDARVGGSFLIVMRIGEQDLPHRGEYLEIVPYERLSFTWLSHVAFAGSRVTLRFEPLANGHTRLTLVHAGLRDEEIRRKHDGGWSHILQNLENEWLDTAPA